MNVKALVIEDGNGTRMELSIDEARELQKQLNGMLPLSEIHALEPFATIPTSAYFTAVGNAEAN